MIKTFVLRPNALLASANSTQRFGSDNIVAVPMAVLDEVNEMKGLSFEKAKIRREIMEYLRSFNFQLLSSCGVKQSNGSILKVIKNFKDVSLGTWEKESSLTEYQKRTLRVCVGLKTSANVVLVTNNSCLQMKAEDLGIKAECFKDETFPRLEEQYTGRMSIFVTDDIFDAFYADDGVAVSRIPELKHILIYENEYVLLQCPKIGKDGKEKVLKGYGKVKGSRIIPVMMHEREPYGISAMNDGQRFLLNALYDESPLTVVKGNAGVGKTFCTLGVALDELESKKYSRILVTRKADFSSIGYLPGEVENKMGPYLAGIKDNLAILINGTSADKTGKNQKGVEDGQYFFERGHIQIQAIELLRGRSIVNTLFIIDETQNIEPDLIKTIVTRAAKGSKFVFLGDPTQIDNPNLTERYNGLVYLSEKMKGSEFCTQITLNDDESVRSDLARYAAKIF